MWINNEKDTPGDKKIYWIECYSYITNTTAQYNRCLLTTRFDKLELNYGYLLRYVQKIRPEDLPRMLIGQDGGIIYEIAKITVDTNNT